MFTVMTLFRFSFPCIVLDEPEKVKYLTFLSSVSNAQVFFLYTQRGVWCQKYQTKSGNATIGAELC